MPLRAHQRHPSDVLDSVDDTDGHIRGTPLAVDPATDARDPFEFFAALATGGYDRLRFTPRGAPTQTWLSQSAGSWVCHTTDTDGQHRVRQSSTGLWDRIEAAHGRWQELGRPARDRFGLTVRDGQHAIWLDHPECPDRWVLRPPGQSQT